MGFNWIVILSVGLVGFSILVVLLAVVLPRILPESARRRLVAIRQSRRIPLLMALIVPAGFLIMVAIFLAPFGGSLFIRVLKNLPMAGMFAGMQFLALSRRPVGDRLRCSRCKYELTGLSPGPSSGPNGRHDGRCPECGGQWGWAGGSEVAVRKWSWPWLAVGVLCLLPLVVQFASAPIKGILWWDSMLLRLAPTSSLVEEVLTQKSFTIAAWAELGKRTLSAADVDRIARKLLTRPSGSYFNTDEQAWLAAALATKSIDADLVKPWLGRMFTTTAKWDAAGSHATVNLRPVPDEFEPFKVMRVRARVESAAETGAIPVPSIVLAARGSPLFQTYPFRPFAVESSGDAMAPRFRGVLWVTLETPAARPGEGLYRVEVPVDVPVEPGR